MSYSILRTLPTMWGYTDLIPGSIPPEATRSGSIMIEEINAVKKCSDIGKIIHVALSILGYTPLSNISVTIRVILGTFVLILSNNAGRAAVAPNFKSLAIKQITRAALEAIIPFGCFINLMLDIGVNLKNHIFVPVT